MSEKDLKLTEKKKHPKRLSLAGRWLQCTRSFHTMIIENYSKNKSNNRIDSQAQEK